VAQAAKQMSAAAVAAMQNRTKNQDPKSLERLQERCKVVRDLDAEIESLNERVEAKDKERKRIVTKELPDMMNELGIPSLEIEAEGNQPAYVVRRMPFYHANIKADWPPENKERAFALLKEMGAPDMLKTIITIELGKGTTALVKKIHVALKKLKVPATMTRGVPYSTLTAFVRELYENNQSLTPQQMEILGASVGTIASIKPKKDRKARSATQETN
jgi:hypothetical protein